MNTNETILIVEDDPAIGRLLGMMLERRGYRVLQAQNGQEGIDLGSKYQDEIDLVMCDIVLKHESGPVVAGAIREVCPQAKVLFISGLPVEVLYEEKLLKPADLEDGSSFYLQKPFLPKDLTVTVESILAPGLAVAAAVAVIAQGVNQNAMYAY